MDAILLIVKQELANFFWKGPDRKSLRLGGPNSKFEDILRVILLKQRQKKVKILKLINLKIW